MILQKNILIISEGDLGTITLFKLNKGTLSPYSIQWKNLQRYLREEYRRIITYNDCSVIFEYKNKKYLLRYGV